MSGFEIVGVVLGVMPLIIEGFDRSQTAFAAFAVYRHYARELSKLESKVGAQRTVFRNNCINLLLVITNDRRKVQDMLAELTHEAWNDASLYQSLKSRNEALNDTFKSCERTLKQIYEALHCICSKMESLNAGFVLDPNFNGVSRRDWWRHFSSRMKLGLQKPGIEQHIEELRSFNIDFDILCKQIIKGLQAANIKDQTISDYRRFPDKLMLAKYHNIRMASQKLYDSLVNEWSCSVHPKHCANISLRGETIENEQCDLNGDSKDSVIVRLEMAITYDDDGRLGRQVPICLEIVSSTEDFRNSVTCTAHKSYDSISTLLKSVADHSALKDSRNTCSESDENVQSKDDLPLGLNALHFDRLAMKNDAAPDLGSVEDVCHHFQQQQNLSHHYSYVGYLNDTFIQKFYQPPTEKCVTGHSMSLDKVISWIAEDPIVRNLPRPSIIQLAGSLAAALLQYHSTPWLSESWRSRDIVFFGIDDIRQGRISLISPHLNVEFSRVKGKSKAEIEEPSSQGSSSTNIFQTQDIDVRNARNEMLFRLGIVLLELGFARPWPMLRASVNKCLSDARNTDYHAAEKLACLLVNTMGPMYPRIIRKCLGCDFGLGLSDLDSEELQGSFLIDVVVALKGLGQSLLDMRTGLS